MGYNTWFVLNYIIKKSILECISCRLIWLSSRKALTAKRSGLPGPPGPPPPPPFQHNLDQSSKGTKAIIDLVSRSIKRQEGGCIAGLVLILLNVVVELRLLLVQLVLDILPLRSLGLQLQDGSGELEDLVLDLAALEGVGLLARRGVDGRVERLVLGVVADLVDRVQEVLVVLVDVGQVVEVQRAEDGHGFVLRVAGDAARDGDVVVCLLAEDAGLGHGCAGSDQAERETHFGGGGGDGRRLRVQRCLSV